MNKEVIIELTKEEKKLLKTLPGNPCKLCLEGTENGYCRTGGCYKIADYSNKVKHVDKNILEIVDKYNKYKYIEDDINQLIEKKNEIKEELNNIGIEV